MDEYAHGVGDCTFAELKGEKNAIKDNAYESHHHRK
jgi:hypothetical protein